MYECVCVQLTVREGCPPPEAVSKEITRFIQLSPNISVVLHEQNAENTGENVTKTVWVCTRLANTTY